MLNLIVVKTRCSDPYYNLALEETLLRRVKKDEIILFLWQNDQTVVIGKNQNPWKECSLKDINEDGIKIARRISGGGAVYHDFGNLNFTFICYKNIYNVEKQIKIIIDSLESFDLKAEYSGRNDLLVQGKKFSGNAFYMEGDACFHHGTVLIKGDMDKLTKYLRVSKEKIESKGIDSIRSRVINLQELNSRIGIENMSNVIIEKFNMCYGTKENGAKIFYPDELSFVYEGFDEEFKKIYSRQISWEWIYGETPEFDIMYKNRFSFGELEFAFKLKDGLIQKVQVYSDSLQTALIDKLRESLKGSSFNIYSMVERIEEINASKGEKEQIKDIISWLNCK